MYLFLFLYMLLLFPKCSTTISSFNNYNYHDEISGNLLSSYVDHYLIVHCDNRTMVHLNDFLNLNNANVPKLLYNYDLGEWKSERPSGNLFVNLVYLSDAQRFERFSRIHFNLENKDVILFVVGENDLPLDLIGLDRAGSVITYNLIGHKFGAVKYYYGQERYVKYDVPAASNGSSFLKYINKFDDFGGHVFQVGYAIYPPFVWCKNKLLSHENCDMTGSEMTLLRDLSKKFNFKFKLVSFVDRPGGDWSEMVKAVHCNFLDWAIGGISVSEERQKMVDFSTSLRTDPHEALFSINENNRQSVAYLIAPFTTTVWLVSATTYVMLCIFYKIVIYLTNARQKSFFSVLMRMITDQPQPKLRIDVGTVKLVYVLLLLYAFMINTFYRSKLTATAIKSNRNEPNKLQDFLELQYKFQVNKIDWSILEEFLQKSTDPIYQQILSQIDANLDYCESIQASLEGKSIVIDELTYLKTRLEDLCAQKFTKDEIHSLRITTENLIPYAHGWAMKLAIPFREKFSMTILVLKASGLIDREIVSPKFHIMRANDNVVQQKVNAIKLRNLIGPFAILTVGYIASLIIFLAELFSK